MSTPETGTSIREFARRDSCDPKLVRRAIGRGSLSKLADGTLDPAHVGGGWRRTNRRAAANNRRPPSEPEPEISDCDIEAVCDPYVAEAGKARDALLMLPSRLGPSMAADLGVSVERKVKALSVCVRQQIDELGELDPDLPE